MASKQQEQTIWDKIKQEHGGTWIRSADGEKFLNHLKRRLEESSNQPVRTRVPNHQRNMDLFNAAYKNLADTVMNDENGNATPVMGGRFNSMHGGPIDFSQDRYRNKPVAFQVPPNQVFVAYSPFGTVVMGNTLHDKRTWLMAKDPLWPTAASEWGDKDTCYNSDLPGQVPGDLQNIDQYYDSKTEYEKAKLERKAAKKSGAEGIAGMRALERNEQELKLIDAIQQQAINMAENTPMGIDDEDWDDFQSTAQGTIRNPDNMASDGKEILWDMQLYFGGNPALWDNDTNTPLPGYDGDWMYNQHHQFEITQNGRDAVWDQMFQNYQLGPANRLPHSLTEAPIGILLEHLNGQPHAVPFENPNTTQTNIVNIGPSSQITLKERYKYKREEYTLTLGSQDYLDAVTTSKSGPEGTWNWQQFITKKMLLEGKVDPSDAFRNNAWLVTPNPKAKTTWSPDRLLQVYGDEAFNTFIRHGGNIPNPNFKGVPLIGNKYDIDDDRRSLWARTSCRESKGYIYGIDTNIYFQSSINYICPWFNNGSHLIGPDVRGDFNNIPTGWGYGDGTDRLGDGNTSKGRKDETSKTFSTTYDIAMLHYLARQRKVGITFFSSCAPSTKTKRIRGEHIPRHAYHSWANVMIRAINQGCGRDNWCMLRGMMRDANQGKLPSYVPQWKKHRGITIMGSDDKHEFYTIMGNYFKRVNQKQILFFPEMFCAFAVGANSDPTNRLRETIANNYDIWWKNPERSTPSIKKYGLLPYIYEIRLWDIKRSLPVPGQEAQRKEAWKMLRREGYKGIGWDEEMGDAQGGGRKKRTRRRRKTRKKRTKRRRRR